MNSNWKLLPLCSLALAGCITETETTTTPSTPDSFLVAPSEPASATLAEFTGFYDHETGEFHVEMLDEVIEDPYGLEFRTDRQALGFCNDFHINVFGIGVHINTIVGSVGDTAADCIDPVPLGIWGPLVYAEGGAFCATVRLENQMDHTLTDVIAEITSITSGYEGYSFITEDDHGCCGTGHDTSGYVGNNAPSDAGGGAFYHSDSLANGEFADQQWTFRNAGGSFEFSGRIVSRVEELPNSLDDDCDGRTDNALGIYPDDDVCRDDVDCVSGLCDAIEIETGDGVCATTCPDGQYGLSCAPCPSCGTGTCNDGAAGDGSCECVAPFAGTNCGECIAGHFGPSCEACVDCGPHGLCSDGASGDGSCVCDPGWEGVLCDEEIVVGTDPVDLGDLIASYTLVTDLTIPRHNVNWDHDWQVPYTTDNRIPLSGTAPTRVAYLMELDGTYIWISMNPFAGSTQDLGLPVDQFWQGPLSGMSVRTNSPTIADGDDLNGQIEFWSNCYSQDPSGPYDSYDNGASHGADCWGSMQLHGPLFPGGAVTPLLNWSGWTSGQAGIGIGPQAHGHPDWTFANNAHHYGSARIRAFAQF